VQSVNRRQFAIMTAVVLFMVLSCLSQSWAATPLNGPRGLALDAKGNLYVANQNINEVLVYNPNYVQQTKKSITSGLSEPVSVAFDSKGNTYVANYGTQAITQYSSAGVQNTKFLITSGVDKPWAITIDGVDDLYVSNNFANITVYPLDDPSAPLLRTITPGGVIYGITVHAGAFYVGSVNVWAEGFVGELLDGGGFPFIGNAAEGLALTTDAGGDLYVANATGSVDFWGSQGGVQILQLNYAPEGIAVDSVRGRLYLSNQNGNQVQVYSTTNWTLLHTIQ